MTDAGYRLTRAVVARMRALGRLRAGLGFAHVVPAVHLSTPIGERERIAGDRADIPVRHSLAVRAVLPQSHVIDAGPDRGARAGSLARASSLAPGGAKASYSVDMRFSGPRLQYVMVAQNRQRGLAPRMAAGASGAPAHQAAPYGPRLAGRASRPSEARSGEASIPASGIAARVRHPIAGANPQHGEAPGFHRTVRQTRPMAPAGDVYLDRNLVGYHLAAAITAEQTRAAARPNISGSSFNSSMAALRPSGAGI